MHANPAAPDRHGDDSIDTQGSSSTGTQITATNDTQGDASTSTQSSTTQWHANLRTSTTINYLS